MNENFFRERINPKTRKNKVYSGIFGTVINIILLSVFLSSCSKDVVNDQSAPDTLKTAFIAETFPTSQADTVVINPVVAVTFKSGTSQSEISASTLTLKQGDIPVTGTQTTSGSTITFTPSVDLKPDTRSTLQRLKPQKEAVQAIIQESIPGHLQQVRTVRTMHSLLFPLHLTRTQQVSPSTLNLLLPLIRKYHQP